MKNMKNNLPLFNLNIDDCTINTIDNNETMGLSFVNIPASLTEWLKFSDNSFKFKLDEDEKTITAHMFRANYPIYRRIGEAEFNVQMDAKSVKNLCLKMMKQGTVNSINLEHKGEFTNEYAFLFESYILTDKHKILYPEFSDIENGSWIVSYKITNDAVWEAIKVGKFNGISPEIPYDLIQVEREYHNILNII